MHISVKDTGQGIAADFLPHAFELFAQQDQTLARSLGGMGVGLTLARRIAQLHGGDVEGFSEGTGKGSEFILWLPLIDEAAAAAPAASAALRLGESCRVLIVEDNADALESLRLQMELWGNEVSTARSAEEALDEGGRRPAADRPLRHRPAGHGRLHAWSPPLRKKLAGTPVVFAAVTGYATARRPGAGARRRLRLVPGQAARARRP